MIRPEEQATGISVRAYFAAMAMQGLLAAETKNWNYGCDPDVDRYVDCAQEALSQADALIDELNKDETP